MVESTREFGEALTNSTAAEQRIIFQDEGKMRGFGSEQR